MASLFLLAALGADPDLQTIVAALKAREANWKTFQVAVRTSSMQSLGAKLQNAKQAKVQVPVRGVALLDGDSAGRFRYETFGDTIGNDAAGALTVRRRSRGVTVGGARTALEKKTGASERTISHFGPALHASIDPRSLLSGLRPDRTLSAEIARAAKATVARAPQAGEKILQLEIEYHVPASGRDLGKGFYLLDEDHGYVVMAHENWRGVHAGMQRKLLERTTYSQLSEVKPGYWLPTAAVYEQFLPDPRRADGALMLSEKSELSYVDWKIDDPLPTELFNDVPRERLAESDLPPTSAAPPK